MGEKGKTRKCRSNHVKTGELVMGGTEEKWCLAQLLLYQQENEGTTAENRQGDSNREFS